MKCAVKLVMNNHFYSFNNEIRRQRKGGPIGNSLTEKVAKLVLKRFDRKFKALLETLQIEIELYRRYVDDITQALEPLAPGVSFLKEEMKMVIVPEYEESDEDEQDDIRTFEELRKIANTIYSCVQFTTDTPSSHVEKTCPVLDLQVFIGKDGLINYKFFSKPCASKFVIPAKLAHGKQMKMVVLV